jgi:hypothetical protein
MQRRHAVELIAISTSPFSAISLPAQEHQHSPSASTAPALKTFFTPAELAVIDDLAERILPADAHSGGAREAKVPAFIDDFVANASAETQAAWRTGIAAVEAEVQRRYGKNFAGASAAQREALLAQMAASEKNPTTDLHRFFARLKAQTISGYYTSPIGLLKDLEYKGIVPQPYYPPCTHPEHQSEHQSEDQN